jgi:hypothetical protein
MTHHTDWLDQIHIGLAIWITLAYVAVPFTALRLLPMTNRARAFGIGFFTTCAITHVAVAAGFHDNHWMLLNDLVQAVSATGFIYEVARMVKWALRRKAARAPEGDAG